MSQTRLRKMDVEWEKDGERYINKLGKEQEIIEFPIIDTKTDETTIRIYFTSFDRDLINTLYDNAHKSGLTVQVGSNVTLKLEIQNTISLLTKNKADVSSFLESIDNVISITSIKKEILIKYNLSITQVMDDDEYWQAGQNHERQGNFIDAVKEYNKINQIQYQQIATNRIIDIANTYSQDNFLSSLASEKVEILFKAVYRINQTANNPQYQFMINKLFQKLSGFEKCDADNLILLTKQVASLKMENENLKKQTANNLTSSYRATMY